jgi:hypothetical protein
MCSARPLTLPASPPEWQSVTQLLKTANWSQAIGTGCRSVAVLHSGATTSNPTL